MSEIVGYYVTLNNESDYDACVGILVSQGYSHPGGYDWDKIKNRYASDQRVLVWDYNTRGFNNKDILWCNKKWCIDMGLIENNLKPIVPEELFEI